MVLLGVWVTRMAEVSRTGTPDQAGSDLPAPVAATPPHCFAYRAYGLTLRSQLPLPELLPAPEYAVPDITIRLAAPAALPSPWRTPGTHFDDPLREVALVYPAGGSFFIREGREILVALMPGQEEAAARLNLLGVALAVAQHQRGRLVLHGSVVAAGGRAVAFLGGSGWGKSTLAASLHGAVTRSSPTISSPWNLSMGLPWRTQPTRSRNSGRTRWRRWAPIRRLSRR